MKREGKILVLVFASLIFLSVLAGFAVAATNLDSITASWNKIVSGLFGTTLTAADTIVIKGLVWVLLFLIIYAIADVLPFLGAAEKGKTKFLLRLGISAVVSYLAVAFLTPGELYASMQSYSAMGVVLTTLVPFAVILTVAWRLLEKPNPGNLLLQKLMFALFAAFLAYKVVDLGATTQVDIWGPALVIYVVAFFVVLGMTLFNRTINGFIISTKVKGYIETGRVMGKDIALADAQILRDRAAMLMRSGAPGKARELEEAAKRLEKLAAETD